MQRWIQAIRSARYLLYVCLYVCACMVVCVYACACVHVYVRACVYMCVCACVCLRVHVNTCLLLPYYYTNHGHISYCTVHSYTYNSWLTIAACTDYCAVSNSIAVNVLCVYISYEGLRSMLYQLQNDMVTLTGQVSNVSVGICVYIHDIPCAYVVCMLVYFVLLYVCLFTYVIISGPIECQGVAS